MSHDLVLAQSHAFKLSRDLMVPVTAFEVDGEYGVLLSEEIDASDDLDIVHEFSRGRLIEPGVPFGPAWYRLREGACKGGCAAAGV